MILHFWLIAPVVFVLWAVLSFPLAVLVGHHLRRNREQHTLSPEEYASIMWAIEDYEGRGNT